MPIALPTVLATDAGRAVTAEADDDTFALVGHGFVAGNTVKFTGLTGGTGITAGATYYVIASGLTADAFKVSATRGGSTINITADLTAGTVTRLLNWEDLKTVFLNEDLGHLSKYSRISTSADLTDSVVFDRTAIQNFYRWRNLPA